MNILLVDDDQVDRALIRRTLRAHHLTLNIVEALSVDEGLVLYAEQSFDVVLIDYRMPQRNGLEMVERIRREPKNASTAIVMMSASEDEELALTCLRAGAQDFIAKSEISAQQLRRALLHATARFELEKQIFAGYQRVKSLAETDSLTGLANRYTLDRALNHEVSSNTRRNEELGLLLFDLDNFKHINDSLGHKSGDEVLKRVASRIQSCLRGDEMFARLGGDEFAILLAGLKTAENASLVAMRILKVLEKHLEIENTRLQISVSIGIALFPTNAGSAEELFRFADIAMYRAKHLGKNRVCFFEPEMQSKFFENMRLKLDLASALANNQFQLHFQPVLHPTTRQISGFEALLRWRVGLEERSAEQFISVAEETRQIKTIGRWVIEQALSTIAHWNNQRDRAWTMAINISVVQLTDLNFVEFVARALAKYKVNPKVIDLEITETALMQNTESVRSVIQGLSKLGVRLSLDDFGYGFSSISHLRNFPISVIKIDKSLMPTSAYDEKNVALITALVYMANMLELDVIAEGVETQLHEQTCQNLQINSVQGFRYSKAVPGHQIEAQFLHTA